jgi:hypothetical protein
MKRWWPALILLVCAGLGVWLRVYPLAIIQPFKHQNPQDLQRALFVFRIAPITALIVALIAAATLVLNWRSLRIGSRIVCSLLFLLTCGAAVLVRVNVFEQMFHPAGTPQFLAIQKAKLDGRDMLVTVALNGDAHAYPIREMGYHHVVNDYVGGVPIVATY